MHLSYFKQIPVNFLLGVTNLTELWIKKNSHVKSIFKLTYLQNKRNRNVTSE